jgi:membrane protein DedA with SNARE-associated domain
MDTALQLVSQYGYVAIFFLLVLGIIGLPIPDETMLTFSGYLIYSGHLNLVATLLTAFAGSMCGITGSYLIGRTGGLYVIHKYGRYIHVTEERIEYVHRWFDRAGHWALFVGYFIPGVRHFTAIVAGTSKLEFPKFALFAYSGALVWVSAFLSLGYFLGEQWSRLGEEIRSRGEIIGLILVGAVVVFYAIRYWRKRKPGQ